MKTPIVSICCITFNHKDYIRETIDGFLLQNVSFAMEIIIHDDASTDGTREILLEYKEKFPDLIHLILQDENQYSKGNKPLNKFVFPQAKGRYIAICEGDDYWTDPNKLQRQVDFLEENPNLIFCYHHASILDFDGEIISGNAGNEIVIIPPEKTISTFIRLLTLVFRNQLENYIKIDFGPIFSGDVALRAYLSTLGGGAYLPLNGAIYRRHPGGVRSGVGIIENYNKWIASRNIILERIKDVSKEDVYRSIVKIHKSKLKHYIMQKNINRTIITLWELIISSLRYIESKVRCL